MLILTIKTDKPESEIGLFKDYNQVAYVKWAAHRQLAETIHLKIEELLKSQNIKLNRIEGIVYYQGPGSFTGLRIGASIANALAYSLEVPIIGVDGTDWIESGITLLTNGKDQHIAMPKYGQPINITQQKK